MILKHESRNTIKNLTFEEILAFYSELEGSLIQISNVLSVVNSVGQPDGLDAWDALDELECVVDSEPGTQAIASAAAVMEPVNTVVARYLYNLVDPLQSWWSNLKAIVDSGCTLDETWINKIKESSTHLISIISYLIVSDFQLIGSLKVAAEGTEQFDEIFETHCSKRNVNPVSIATSIYELYKTYQVKFKWFEEYPELEEQFIDIMGPYYEGLQEDMLTLELVKSVISGEITPESLFASMELDSND